LKPAQEQPEVIKPIQNHHEALKTTHKQPEVIKPIQNHHGILKTTHKQPEVIKPIQNHHEALKTTQEQPEVIKNPSGQQYLEEESTEPVYSYYEDEIQDMRNVPVTHNESKFSHMAGDTTDLSSYFVKAESSSETNSQLF
ncbi:DNA repair protein RAD50, ABC-type ATPase/SMC superfamily, partial [Pseudoloma neurophilia]